MGFARIEKDECYDYFIMPVTGEVPSWYPPLVEVPDALLDLHHQALDVERKIRQYIIDTYGTSYGPERND